MLKKELTLPGAKIQVRSVIKDGLGGTTPTLPVFDLSVGPLVTATFGHGVHTVVSGSTLTVVSKPKKRDGINLVKVELPNGTVGEVYWCALRASCDHI